MIPCARDICSICSKLPLALALMVAVARGGEVEPVKVEPAVESRFYDRWSFEYGVAFITSQNIEQLIGGEINVDDGPAGGEMHFLTACYLLSEPEWSLFGRAFHPALELPLMLGIVDENGRSPFFSYNASFQIRWRDFPWNDHVLTSFTTGVGLSWSEKVYAMDIQRHPDEDRSKWKFNWPLQLSLAHPSYPCHHLLLFIAHQSGGTIFDRGGVNSLGIGYRFATW